MDYTGSFPFLLSEKHCFVCYLIHNCRGFSGFFWWPNLASVSEDVAESGPYC